MVLLPDFDKGTNDDFKETLVGNNIDSRNNSTNHTWQDLVTELENTINIDRNGLLRVEQKSIRSRQEGHLPLFKHNINLYMNYLCILTKLETIYNGMTHPQKREHIKGTLTLVIRRVIQLRHYFYHNPYWKSTSVLSTSAKSLPQVESWEYLDFNSDAFSTELKFQWNAMQTPIPQFIQDDCKNAKITRNSLVAQYIRSFQCNSEEEYESIGQEATSDNETSFLGSMRNHTPTALELGDYTILEMNAIQNKAATTIQRYTRGGYFIRLQQKRNTAWIQMFIGMMDNTFDHDLRETNKKRLADLDERKEYEMRRNKVGYKDALSDLRDEVRRDEGFAMKQDLRAKRIEWVTAKIAETNQVPESLQEFYDSKASNDSTGEPNDQNVLVDYDRLSSALYNSFKDDILKFNMLWANEDESKKNEMFSAALAKDLVVRDQVRAEIQKTVDHELLTNLKRINELDSGKKTKNTSDKTKKGKNGKSKKGKKEKGLPGDKFIDLKGIDTGTIIEKLARYELIEIPQDASMDNFVCSNESKICVDEGYVYPPIPTISEAKRLIIEYGILPIGTREIKEATNEAYNVRSILLFGPKGCGKKHIARAVANELGAIFIDFSPSKIPEETLHLKGGPTKLLHLVFTLAKDEANSPVVIFIGECEKYFQSTKKKKGKSIFASKFQKELLIYKNQGIRHERIVIIGSTTCPWEADAKQLKWKGPSGKPEKQGFFEHMIYIPNPGYADRSMLWHHFVDNVLSEYETITKHLILDYELLSRYSKGYSSGAIKDTVNKIITLNRISEPNAERLEEELIADLSRKEALQSDEVYSNFCLQLHVAKASKGGKTKKGKKSKK